MGFQPWTHLIHSAGVLLSWMLEATRWGGKKTNSWDKAYLWKFPKHLGLPINTIIINFIIFSLLIQNICVYFLKVQYMYVFNTCMYVKICTSLEIPNMLMFCVTFFCKESWLASLSDLLWTRVGISYISIGFKRQLWFAHHNSVQFNDFMCWLCDFVFWRLSLCISNKRSMLETTKSCKGL